MVPRVFVGTKTKERKEKEEIRSEKDSAALFSLVKNRRKEKKKTCKL